MFIDVVPHAHRPARARAPRSTADQPDADEWLRKTRISLWRMLKFQMKADPMNVDATAATVYRHRYHDADIADHLWTDLTFPPHRASGRVSEMCDLVVRHVDALRANRPR
jgi:hypothetical protein